MMADSVKCLGTIAIMCLLFAAGDASAEKFSEEANLTTKDYATVDVDMGPPGGAPLHILTRVDSMMGLRHAHVQLQERDYSCGAASMTSIFKFYLGENVTEMEVIHDLLELAKQRGTLANIIKRRGFTLLDLKRYAESKGYKTSAFKLEFDDLVALGEPALVPIIPYGYKHFVVFRGADDKYVYLADPSFGNLTQPIADFKRDWYGFVNVALVVHRKKSADKNKVPPLVVSKKERFDMDSTIDSFLHTDPPQGPLVRTEF
ncbi:MAG: C39 family peptidase [Anaerolineales bacterium]|jgi:predicted double-glycine peptidase